MNHNIKGTALDVSQEIKDYVADKLARVDKFFKDDSAVHTSVELEYFVGELNKKYRAEFAIASGRRVFRAEARGESLHEAVDIAVGEVTKEIDKNKKRNMRLFRRGAMRIKEFVRGFRNRP